MVRVRYRTRGQVRRRFLMTENTNFQDTSCIDAYSLLQAKMPLEAQ